jgi:hypothetical protein
MDMGLEGWNQGDARVTRPRGGFICNVNVDIDPGPLEDDFGILMLTSASKRASWVYSFCRERRQAVEMDGDGR